MTREQAFECVIEQNGERFEDAFYGVDYAEARQRADNMIENARGQGDLEITQITFECER